MGRQYLGFQLVQVVTGVGVTSAYTFGMAFDDSKADVVHFVRQG
jgi:hypothetical protein